MPVKLPEIIPSFVENYAMLNDGEGKYWFHHKPSFPDTNPTLYKKLIMDAELSIEIWDPYFHIDIDCTVFSETKSNLTIQILTQKGLNGIHSDYKERLFKKMQEIILEEKRISFCLGVINKCEFKNKNWEFHDRFLIIDRKKVYLVGASIEYFHISKKPTGIYRVTNERTLTFIISLFETYWEKTEKYPEHVTLLH